MSQHDEQPIAYSGSPASRVSTTAQKLARLTELDAERAQLVSELREDFAAMRAVLPRLRKPKAPAAAKRGRPRKVKGRHRSQRMKLDTFSVRDQESWDKDVAANMDGGYGQAVLEFAARWAALMEARLVNGATVADVARGASHDADTEGITGFMYVCAVSCLSRAWEHGVALRTWHNLDTQIGTEGELANANGGVLNPALLNIG